MFEIAPMYTSGDVRRTADSTGSFYFSDATMRWWNSRLLEGFWPINEEHTSGFIVVSNRDRDNPREYNVVMVEPATKPSEHVGLSFNTVRSFGSAREAKKFAKESADFFQYDALQCNADKEKV